MLFREALNNVEGFRYIEECMTIRSSAGRRVLYATPFMTDPEELEAEYERISQVLEAIWPDPETRPEEMPDFDLSQLKDINGTLGHLRDGHTLGDIELFEVKELALFTLTVCREMKRLNLSVFRLPDLQPVVEILDPERNGVPVFYIYDSYSSDLAEIRKEMQREKDVAVLEGLRSWEIKLEDEVRERLAEQLRAYYDVLSEALEQLARLDILVGKAEFAQLWDLSRPQIRKRKTSYEKLYNLQVEYEMEERKQRFQPVYVSVERRATVITGANMSGKSVLLHSLMMAQYMAQFGFFVPAYDRAEIVLVDEVFVCIGDGQDRRQGLSSYAAEMLKINEIILAVRAGKKILALIDEPARTTNPEEGKAIVNALLHFLTQHKVLSVVTTHYSGLTADCRRLKVSGFSEYKMFDFDADGERVTLTADNINRYIDYSLVPDTGESAPKEALRIAEMLGVDRRFVVKAKEYWNTKK